MSTNPNDTTPSNTALPTVIEYITQSGVLIQITPLSLFTVQAVINKSESLFEYPPEKEYRLYEMEFDEVLTKAEDVSASGFFPATENPEYRALCASVDNERTQWQNDAFIELACAYPQYASRLEMIAAFRPRLEELRPYVELHEDEWQNVLEFCVFTGSLVMEDEDKKRVRTPERHRVIQYARQNMTLALTTSEVVGSLRVFQFDYMGMELTKWLEVGHPGLTNKIHVTSNTLAMEFDACATFGIDPYMQIMTRPREWRAGITAHHIGRNMIEAMRFHDSKPKDKKRGKNK